MIGRVAPRLCLVLAAFTSSAAVGGNPSDAAPTGNSTAAAVPFNATPVPNAKSVAASEVPSVEDFFRKPKYGGAALSPSGRYIAMITPIGERPGVSVVDLSAKTAVKMETPYNAGDVLGVSWQSDQRMIVTIGDRQRVAGERPSETGLIAVNRDGTDSRLISPGAHWYHVIPGSTEIVVVARGRNLKYEDIYRYDTET